MQLDRNGFFVSAKGGALTVVGADGVVAFTVAVPPGRVGAADFADLVPEGGECSLSDGLKFVMPRGLTARVMRDDAYDTAANPDYQPSPASAFERQIRGVVMGLQAKTEALEAEIKARQAVAALPRGEAAAKAMPEAKAEQAPDDKVVE